MGKNITKHICKMTAEKNVLYIIMKSNTLIVVSMHQTGERLEMNNIVCVKNPILNFFNLNRL